MISRLGSAFALEVALAITSSGCWMAQGIPWPIEDDTDSESETETETETETVDPHKTCNVDIVFVIDSSQSMMLTLDNLVSDGFAGFLSMMASYPQPGTIRVGVTNHLWEPTYVGGELIDPSGFLTHGWIGAAHDIETCSELATEDCGFASDRSWMEGPSDTLNEEFTCVGNLPCQEDIAVGEPTLEAGVYALEKEAQAGFLRDDALLFVVFITDEEDQSLMPIQEVRARILAAKDDEDLYLPVEDYVYVATIAGNEYGGCEDGDFFGEADATPKIIEFCAQFSANGRHFDMCSTTIETALSSMSTMMQQGCQAVFDLD